ncbi:hypothetical protein LO772_16480 [Yinghuangia sp. ASG 101]|uniref:hypothetical protein n=1 Tax=Yinghuangia sp. ASG 101 TaxID=2896848 RepID=UPI001E2A1D82|nr:hypothetical protein [Yinghuangia sp. ASG 101]UGQ15016.1 hypothetical protein LO772_16480 [Yinghuangia sp. ASG 101]
MGEGADRAGDFEEPATAGSTVTRTEPPLRVGVWSDFDRDGNRVAEEVGEEVGEEFGEEFGGGDDDGEASEGGFRYAADAALPHARKPVPPGDDEGEDEHGDEHEDEGAPDAGATAAHEPAEAGGVTDHDGTDATYASLDDSRGAAPGDDTELPVFPPVTGPFDGIDPGRPAWPQPQLLPGASPHPSPYPGFEAYANAFPGALPAAEETAESRRGRRGADERKPRDDRDGADTHRAAAEAPEPRRPRGPFETVVLFCAPAVVLVGLVLYFGWARSAAISDYLGFDEEVLGYTAKEYLVRGVDTLDRPMLAVFAGLLALRMAHPRLVVHLRRHRRAAVRLSWGLRCAWFAVPAAAWAVVLRWPEHRADRWPVLLPGALAVGVLVSAYGVLISRQLGAHRRETGMGVRPWSLSVVLTASTVVLCLFWALGAYAETEGRTTARRMVEELPTRTAVVVYSVRDLHVAAEQGVTVEALTAPDASASDEAYRFRYGGLRLLRHADGQLYLLPDRWSWNRPRLVVIRADSGVRVDYLRVR